MVRTKDTALKFLRSLVDTSNKLTNLLTEIEKKLSEIEELQRDNFIGLALTKDQLALLNSKNAYTVLKNEIESMKPVHVENIDDTIKTCVESIFLEKKEERKRTVEDKKVIVNQVKKMEPKVEEKKEVGEVYEQIDVLEDTLPKSRVPYAWKSGSTYEGGSRERKKDHVKKKVPSKEYRGWDESKKMNKKQ